MMKEFCLSMLVSLIHFSSCTNAAPPKDPIPVHETFTIKSKVLSEDRTICIWKPSDYDSISDSLPVLYMPDGGINEDFPHIANTIEKLIKEKKIKPLILVGIENTQRRRDLSGFTAVEKDKEIAPVVGGSAQFRAFLKDELMPEINSRYRTTNEKSIIGESLAGLFVMETFFLFPDMFDRYIAFDPSLWWNNHYLVSTSGQHLAKFPESNKKLWFAGSGATDISPYTKELAAILAKLNIPQLQWKYADEPKEKHTTIFRATKEKAIIWALNDKP